MSTSTTLYRFKIELSDIDRAVYETLDLRVAQHPSENHAYLLTRVLAYALNYQEGLAFSAQGLGNPDDPTLSVPDAFGGVGLWIEIGNPSVRKMHKASKAAKNLKIYTYKDPKVLINEILGGEIHKAEQIEVSSFASNFLDQLTASLERDNRWTMIHNDGTLSIDIVKGPNQESLQGDVRPHPVVAS